MRNLLVLMAMFLTVCGILVVANLAIGLPPEPGLFLPVAPPVLMRRSPRIEVSEAQPAQGIEVVKRDGQWFPVGSLPELPDKGTAGEMWCHYGYTNAQEWRRCNLIPDEVAIRAGGEWQRQKIGALLPGKQSLTPIRNGELLTGPSVTLTLEEWSKISAEKK